MAVWFVYRHEGQHLGPLTTEAVVEQILAGTLGTDVWIAAPGGPRWLRALEVPIIAQLIDGQPTRRRRDSGLRIVPGAHASMPTAIFGSTVMMVNDDELDELEPSTVEVPEPPPTERDVFDPFTTDPAEYGTTPSGEKRGPDGFPLPPSSSSPKPAPVRKPTHMTLESAGTRPKKSRGA